MSTTPEPTKRCCEKCKCLWTVCHRAAHCRNRNCPDCHKTETQTTFEHTVTGNGILFIPENSSFDGVKGPARIEIKNTETQTPSEKKCWCGDAFGKCPHSETHYVDSRTPEERERDAKMPPPIYTSTSETKQNGVQLEDDKRSSHNITKENEGIEKIVREFTVMSPRYDLISKKELQRWLRQALTTQRNEERARLIELVRKLNELEPMSEFGSGWNAALNTLISKLKEE